MTKNKMKFKILAGGATLATTLLCSQCMIADNNDNSVKSGAACAVDPSQIYIAPSIPQNIEFCGEKLELKNYYMRERFDRELLSFSYFHSSIFLMVKRANRYFPILEKILKEEGIPDDFKYLAVIESCLDQRALSPTKAAGIWQIMEQTGKEAGLMILPDVDERYNLEKATRAACRHLKQSYDATGSWTLAAASYNTGRARVVRQMEAQQTKNFFDMQFSEETNRYVYRILLAKYVLEDPSRVGFYLTQNELYFPVETFPVQVDTAIPNLTEFAKSYGITLQLLKDSNAWMRDNSLKKHPGKTFTINIPKKECLNLPPSQQPVHNQKWIQCVPAHLQNVGQRFQEYNK